MIELKASMRCTRYGDHEVIVWRRFPGTRWFEFERYSDMVRAEAEDVLDTLITELLTGRHPARSL